MGDNADVINDGITWILVADASEATIYSRRKRYSALQLREQFDNPAARLKSQDTVSDRPGRSFDSHGAGRHAMEPGTSATDIRRGEFARQLARRLEEGRQAREFEKLILIAGPAMLGELRNHLTDATQASIDRELAKDLSRAAAERIAEALDS